MLDAMHATCKFLTGKTLCKQFGNASAGAPILEPTEQKLSACIVRYQMKNFSMQIGPVILIDRDVLYIGQLQTRLKQTIFDGLRRKTRPMFDAPKSLLFCGRHEFAIANQCGCRIGMEGVQTENDHFRPFAATALCAAACGQSFQGR
jgi:hypothetical protein